MSFLDQDRKFQRADRRRKRRERRQKIVDRLAKVAGLFAGSMFGTGWIGWLVGGLIILAGVAYFWR